MKVYTVFGSSGEYSDRWEWPIASYLDEELAKAHIELATKENRRIRLLLRNKQSYEPNIYDSETQDDWDEHEYYYETTEILTEIYKEGEKL